ncbi:MAG: hypothetical protein CMO01_27720 [Thalassobius sp.]|nr:hypothetical protein [Thalassovita sp.]
MANTQTHQLQLNQPKQINDANLSFYEKIDINRFIEFAKIIGLSNGADIKAINSEFCDAKVIAEIGAGYGRAIEAIINENFQGKIYAVERVAHLVSYMKHQFASNEHVEIIHDDAKKLKLPEKIDCFLWLWSGIMELSLDEQENALKELKNQLNPGGKVIIETPYEKVKYIGEKSPDNFVKFETDWGKLEAYLSTLEELQGICEKAGFKSIRTKLYNTESDLTRIFYIYTI